jgi:hypothetical protein
MLGVESYGAFNVLNLIPDSRRSEIGLHFTPRVFGFGLRNGLVLDFSGRRVTNRLIVSPHRQYDETQRYTTKQPGALFEHNFLLDRINCSIEPDGRSSAPRRLNTGHYDGATGIGIGKS